MTAGTAAAHASADFLAAVEGRLQAVVGGEQRLERAAARLVLASSAKRARAHVCRALAASLGVTDTLHHELAVVVELIHGASLLHDDVVDRSELRRGQPTVNATDGNAFAVLCGDLVLARALALTAALPGGALMVCDAIDVVERMTRAAVIEVEARTVLPTPAEGLALWHDMARGKTGALFGLCGSLMARAAGVDDDVRIRLRDALESIGIAFQLIDDLSDVAGTDAGKPRGQDLREHALNFTVLQAMVVDDDFAAGVQGLWRSGSAVASGDIHAACDRALAVGGQVTVDEARAAVQDGAGSGAPALAREVLPWAQQLVRQATVQVQAHGQWPGGLSEGQPANIDNVRG